MTTMLRWSPSRKFHFHHDVDAPFPEFFNGATDEAAQRAPSWLPAAEGRIDDGTYVIQLAMPGVDPKDVQETVKGIGKTLTEGVTEVEQRAKAASAESRPAGEKLEKSAQGFGESIWDGMKSVGRSVQKLFMGS